MVDTKQQQVSLTAPQTKLIKPKTRRGKRALEKKAPKLVEDSKRALLLYGNDTSQTIKDVLVDLHKLKGVDGQKFTRKNPDVKPFEPGGEVPLQFFANKANCSLFALGSHSKKRPHNLVLGRLYDFHLYDALELGIELCKPLSEFKGAAAAQAGNKPCMVFVGDKFDSDPDYKLAKSILLDFFRGLQVDTINLAGLDRVMVVVAIGDKDLLIRQYSIKFKKSGTKVPRAALTEMGPSLDLRIRRHREPPVDLELEALKQPKVTKKKEKNVGSDMLDGKVGRIYMPKQDVATLGLSKMKGLKRERREAKAVAKAANRMGDEQQASKKPKQAVDHTKNVVLGLT
eukprot:jgi/Chrzof1/1035/Cz01g37260.t1